MDTPTYRYRARAHDIKPSFLSLTDRQRERQESILEITTCLLAEFGTQNATFSNLAIGLRLTRAALRFHFTDLHTLLAEILTRHLNAIATAIGDVAPNDPHRHQRMRAAYLAATRTPSGTLTDAHTLLVRDRHLLPPDLLQSIELTRQGLAVAIAGDLAEEAMSLLDNPALGPTRIEACLAPRTTKPIQLPPPPPRPVLQPCTYTPSCPPMCDDLPHLARMQSGPPAHRQSGPAAHK